MNFYEDCTLKKNKRNFVLISKTEPRNLKSKKKNSCILNLYFVNFFLP